MEKNKISVVLGTYNRREFLKLTIGSARKELENHPHELIVVDGGSNDGTIEWLTTQKDIITIVQHNRGTFQDKPIECRSWGYFMNLGFKCAQGKYICMVSDDCLIVPGAIVNGYNSFEKLLAQGEQVGALAFFWRDWPYMKKYFVGNTIGHKMIVNHGMYLKKALENVNYIDESAYRFYCADGDLCLRMDQAGYKTASSPNSFIEHYSHANESVRQSNNKNYDHDWQTYISRWSDLYRISQGENIEQEYDDPHQTAQKFQSVSPLGHYKKVITREIKRWIKQTIHKTS